MSVAKVADVFVGDKNPSFSASLLTFCKKCATCVGVLLNYCYFFWTSRRIYRKEVQGMDLNLILSIALPVVAVVVVVILLFSMIKTANAKTTEVSDDGFVSPSGETIPSEALDD